jgi:formylglycine-generating enzyme required for sulfatase activity/predicted Ser/Thr protein kinase
MQLPEQFGRYRILKRLGGGGMGTVYLAKDEQLDRLVALKVPHFRAEDSREVLARFLQEARAAATLHHANICPVYDVGVIEGVHYLTMMYIDGQPLTEVIRKEAPLAQQRAAALVKKLALALDAAHRHGIIHRDLKSSNIMISADGEPIILDFGLARRLDQQGTRVTRSGVLAGTPTYMAPEQAKEGLGTVGAASDIYSLGVILYELLTKRLPFEGPLTEVLINLVTREPPPPSAHRTDLDPVLNTICLKALAKEPTRRFATMAQMGATLEAYLRGPAAKPAATAVAKARPGSDKSPRESGRKPVEGPRPDGVDLWWWVAAGTLTLLVAGVVVFVVLLFFFPSPNPGTGGNPGESDGSRSQDGRAAKLAVPPPDERKKQVEGEVNLPALLAIPLDGGVTMEFVRIPAGTFRMGSPPGEKSRENSEGQHEVEIARAFYLGKYAVTQQQYEALMGSNPSYFSAKGGGQEKVQGVETSRFPVEQVSWEDAVRYCAKLTEKAGKGGRTFRLPTEAEWEYACRAGMHTAFAFGDMCNGQQANCNGTFPFGTEQEGPYLERPCAVGSYQPNAFGLYDMHGNVYQWCQDWYDAKYYDNSPNRDPQGPNNGDARVVRGGSWIDGPGRCRAAHRLGLAPSNRYFRVGFRVAFY